MNVHAKQSDYEAGLQTCLHSIAAAAKGSPEDCLTTFKNMAREGASYVHKGGIDKQRWTDAFHAAAEFTDLVRVYGYDAITQVMADAFASRPVDAQSLNLDHRPIPSVNPAVDLLQEAVAHVRGHLDRSLPVSDRLRTLWAGVAAARDLGATDVIADAFAALAHESGLAADLGQHGAGDVRAVIRAGLLDQNCFD